MILIIAAACGLVGALIGALLLEGFVAPSLKPGPDAIDRARMILLRARRTHMVIFGLGDVLMTALLIAVIAFILTPVRDDPSAPWGLPDQAFMVGILAFIALYVAGAVVDTVAKRRASWLLTKAEASEVFDVPQPRWYEAVSFVIPYAVLTLYGFEGSGAVATAILFLAIGFPVLRVVAWMLDWGWYGVASAIDSFGEVFVPGRPGRLAWGRVALSAMLAVPLTIWQWPILKAAIASGELRSTGGRRRRNDDPPTGDAGGPVHALPSGDSHGQLLQTGRARDVAPIVGCMWCVPAHSC